MAFTGRRQAALDEIDEDKEANLDPWAKSQLPGEEAATKALDELRLTPNLDGFLCPALVNALDPNDSKNYDAELRRAWLRLDEQRAGRSGMCAASMSVKVPLSRRCGP